MCRYWLSCVCLALVVCSSVLADDAPPELTAGVVGKKYAEQISVSVSGVAPFTYALGGEEKPAGLSIDPQTGLLHGVPTKAAVGTHRVHVVITDYAGTQTTQDFVLHVTATALPAMAPAAKPAAAAAAVGIAAVKAPVKAPVKAAVGVVGSPVITSATSGLNTVSVTSPPFPPGVSSATYQLSVADVGQTTCAAGNGTAVIAAGSVDAKTSADTTIQLAAALKENGILCVEESLKDAAGKEVATAYSKTFPVTGSPSMGAAVAGATTVVITSPAFPSGATAGVYNLYVIDTGKVCSDGGTALSVTNASTTGPIATTVTLSNGLADKSTLCASETFGDAKGNVIAIAYSIPVPVAEPGSPSIASAPAGVSNVSVTSPAFPGSVKTATFGIYAVDPGQACKEDGSKQLATVAGTSVDAKASDTVTLTLTNPLKEGSVLCAVETFKDDKGNTIAKTDSNPSAVSSLEANWGRVRAYFVGGVLITNDSSSFSSAHQFYALNVEKTWDLPYCYLGPGVGNQGEKGCIAEGSYSTVGLSGGSVQFTNPIRISGGSANVGPPFAIQNVTITVTGEETITTATGIVHLHSGQSFTVTSGTLTGTFDPAMVVPRKPGEGAKVPAVAVPAAKLEITKGILAITQINPPPANWAKRLIEIPGVTTYFETRLTSIPVVSNAANTTCTPTGSSSTSTSSSGSSTSGSSTTATGCSTSGASGTATSSSGSTSSSGNTTSSFLTSQQTANVGVGVYLPFLVSRWLYKNTPNALFIAPIGKIGFNTITAATAQTVVLAGNGGTGTQTFEQIYNFYDYGFRIGHMGLTNTTQVAPELYSYLDFSLGRFSNLESLICHRVDQRGTTVANSGCISAFGSQYTVDSRKRLYRIDIEGLLKIPSTPIYLGLNANIGQKQVMAEKLDPNFAAPNDLRFLFGTKFDIAQVFQKLGVKQPQ